MEFYLLSAFIALSVMIFNFFVIDCNPFSRQEETKYRRELRELLRQKVTLRVKDRQLEIKIKELEITQEQPVQGNFQKWVGYWFLSGQ